MLIVDVGDMGLETKFDCAEQAGDAAVVAVDDLVVEKQAEAFFEAQALVGSGLDELLLEGIGHADEAQASQRLHDVFGVHVLVS